MTDVTDDELLRLAEKVWPDHPAPDCVSSAVLAAMGDVGSRGALHAALLVLAGELDVADAEARGRAAEREAVCAYLSLHHEGWVPSKLVPAIERGEHAKGSR